MLVWATILDEIDGELISPFLTPPPPPPNNRNRKMVHFGFCVALFLIWGGGGWGFAVSFLMSKVAAPQGPPTI